MVQRQLLRVWEGPSPVGLLARAGWNWENPSPAGLLARAGLAVHWVFPQPAEPFACRKPFTCWDEEWGPA